MRKDLKVVLKEERSSEKILKQEQDEIDKGLKLVQLLPNSEENLIKLREMMTKSHEKMAALKEKYLEAKNSLDSEYQEMKINFSTNSEEYSDIDNRMILLKEKISSQRKEIEERNAELIENEAALAKAKAGDNRDIFTSRVLEVLQSIDKQKSETERVISDVKRTQKDINFLDGKLFRTYAEADAVVFQVKILN